MADVVVVDASKLGNTPNNQRVPPHVQAQHTVEPPPLLSQQGQFPQPHASIRANYLPRTSKYQPLSPPITPGNQMYMMPPMRPPSPMSNPLAPRPLLGMFPRTPLAFQQHMHVNMPPFSPPHQHPSPIRTPVSPLLRPQATNPMVVNDQRMFSEVPPQMLTVPGSPPQPRDTHIAQVFGSPNNPFQFNFFPRQHIMFLNNSQQPLGSPPLLQQGPGSPFTRMPVVGSDILNRSPRVISCEELERGDGHVQLPQRDQPDGVPRTPTNEARSLRATEKVPNTDIPPSVLEGLRSLNIDEGHSSTERADQTHTVPSAQQEASTGIVSDVKSTTKDIAHNESQDFHPPPKIQNVAVAAMVRMHLVEIMLPYIVRKYII